MKFTKWLLAAGLMLMLALPATAQNKKNSYTGAGGCKICHSTKKSGAQYKVWQKSKHAQAFAVLATEKAKTVAKTKGIADPQKADECLQCHVTAFGVATGLLGKKYKAEDGVGCEACHGPGSAYKSKKVMTGITAGKIDPASVGLVKPTEKTCTRCHNEKSPTYKPFDFKERVAKIAHPRPKK